MSTLSARSSFKAADPSRGMRHIHVIMTYRTKPPLNRNSRGNNSSPMGSGIAHVFLHASKALVSGHVYLLQALNTLNTFFDLGFDLKSAGEEFENVWRKAATSAASGD